MPKRSPAGSVKAAAQVKALSQELTPAGAAQLLGTSPGRVSAIANQGPGAFGSKKNLAAWQSKIENASRIGSSVAKRAIRKQAASKPAARKPSKPSRPSKPARKPSGRRPAPKVSQKAARAAREEAGRLRGQHRPKEIGQAGGMSYQKASAILRRLASGRPLSEADRALLDKALENLDQGIRDGVQIVGKARAAEMLAGMSAKERAAHHSQKCFDTWEQMAEWYHELVVPNVGDTSAIFFAYNAGTAERPCWNAIWCSNCKKKKGAGEDDEESEDESDEELEEEE